ncbi:glycosyltransferase family 2 protein [Pediococcus claussenii]|uniref:glycosyltransferase family 2 protein n=1 Tax=Pediococcus claussenii TaxID=187452 RepID=UPI0002D97168|nr:glycosyltransferase family A protein [Pediococcus claussenii]ANZ69664.1 hypothetical protein AYR57_04755 [Pediococcus claussenii]ANZ71481.1 hypothetical protein AYR58_04760 [Pediococcus claussenii]KRN19850.1 hypothetical protein IV79_GL001139 [Pediococcus claussenii]
MKLSIIVTAFNEEKYINRCLESLLTQKTNYEYEVIVVNDGSTDGTQKIINKYTELDGNKFRAFYKSNSGQRPSRNYGIKKSIGDYISFADADDWVDSSFVEYMCKSADEYNSDVVTCDVHKIFVSKKYRK